MAINLTLNEGMKSGIAFAVIHLAMLAALCASKAATLDDVPWIGDGQPERNGADWYDEDPAPEFMAEFVLPEGVTTTKVHFACAGFGEWSIGARLYGGMPYTFWTPYDKTVYDMVTRPIRVSTKSDPVWYPRAYPATNTVYVWLGNGFYNLPPLRFWGAKCFREALAQGRPCFKMSIEGLDKPLEWKWRKTNVIRNSVYLGSEIDATRPKDAEWKPAAVVEGPKGKIVEWPAKNPSSHYKGVDDGKARWLREGEVQIVDFGTNASGVPSFKFAKEARGTRIEIIYGERLNADGTVNPLTQTAGQIKRPGMGGPGAPDIACQRDSYICRGPIEPEEGDDWEWAVFCGKWELFRPMFAWHVFRYAEVRGAKHLLEESSRWRISLLPDSKPFKADDPALDALHEICVRTFRANMIGGVQSDCPGRERLGYGGDIVATYEAYMMNWDMREIYLKILRDFADEAEDDGWITETAPYVGIADRGFGGRSGPISWSLAVPELMDGILRHYNDKRALDFYPVCARYVRLVAEKCPDGLVPNCIGDHEALERAPDGCTATAHWHRFVELTAKFAKMLGRAEDEKEFTALAEKIRGAFVAKYVKDGVVANGTQSAQAIGLYLGLVPEEQREAALAKLVAAVEEKDCGPTTGIFSTRYMLMYLSENGRVDLARKIVLHKGFPGWLHMIDRGATTLWETWKESDNVYSNCHPMFGSVDEWILKYGFSDSPVAVSPVLIRYKTKT